jgi:hypothetical protein
VLHCGTEYILTLYQWVAIGCDFRIILLSEPRCWPPSGTAAA